MKWNLLAKWRNTIIAFCSDGLMILLSLYGACYLFSNPDLTLSAITISLLLATQCLANIYCGLYRGIWRFASIPDLLRILRAVLLGTAALSVILKPILASHLLPFCMIYALLLSAGLCGSRILFRCCKDANFFFQPSQRTLIVGAGNAGEGIARDLLRLPKKKYRAVAFVDDSEKKQGCDIRGVPVVGKIRDIVTIVKKLKIELILIAIPSAGSEDMQRILRDCEQANVPFRTLPGLKDMANGTVSLNALREVLLDDLLGREQVLLDWQQIQTALAGKNILVTGGGGSIGSELCRQIASQAPASLIIVDNNEFNLYKIEMELIELNAHNVALHFYLCSVTDKIGLQGLFDKHRPDLVFHSAAYKHVPMLEKQIRFAINNNVIGTRIVAEMAERAKVKKFILISTDKAVNPANVMGATKRAAEIFCQNMNFQSETTQFITVRFGNVLNSAGSVVPLFRKQINEGGPVTVTHREMTRYFMTIPEASQLIMQAAAMGTGGEIYVLDMGNPVKVNYLAEQLIKLSGKVVGHDVQIKYIGLRPGEKLHEELFHSDEPLATTPHRKISEASVRRCDWPLLLKQLEQIELASEANAETQLKQLLLKIVPEYVPEEKCVDSENAGHSLEESFNYA